MTIVTQKLRKEVVSYEIVDQVTSFSCSGHNGDEVLIVSSNYGSDGDESLLHAKVQNETSYIRPLNVRIEDDEDNVLSEMSITLDNAIELAHSLLAMANFVKDQSNYTEVK